MSTVGWPDVATKHDFDQFREEVLTVGVLKADIQAAKAGIERALRHQTRILLMGLAAINLVSLGVALAGARLLGA